MPLLINKCIIHRIGHEISVLFYPPPYLPVCPVCSQFPAVNVSQSNMRHLTKIMPYFTATLHSYCHTSQLLSDLFNENARHFEAVFRCTAVGLGSFVGLGDRLHFVGLITLQEQLFFSLRMFVIFIVRLGHRCNV